MVGVIDYQTLPRRSGQGSKPINAGRAGSHEKTDFASHRHASFAADPVTGLQHATRALKALAFLGFGSVTVSLSVNTGGPKVLWFVQIPIC